MPHWNIQRNILAQAQNRANHANILNTDGSIKGHGDHIHTGPITYFVKDKNGQVHGLVYHPKEGNENAAGATAPVNVSPTLPNDFGSTRDLTNNILWSNPWDIEDVEQWQVADCYFLSPIGSFIYDNPWFLPYILVKNSDNTFTAYFRSLYRNAPLYQITVNGLVGSTGCQPNPKTGAIGVCLLEKAYAWLRNGSNTLSSLGYGYPATSYNDFGISCLYLNPQSGAAFITAAIAGLAQKQSMCVCTNATIVNNAPLIEAHCYMVLQVNPVGNNDATILLGNPWGINSSSGTVTVTLAQFQQNCGAVVVANTYPVTHSSPVPSPLPVPMVTPPAPPPSPPTPPANPPQVTLSANSTSVYLGDQVRLIWGALNATSATLNGNTIALSGMSYVYPQTNPSTYTISATGAGGTVTHSIHINVFPPGDLNKDGKVDFNDMLVVTGNWNQHGGLGDANKDGIVNSNDMLIVTSNWGKIIPSGI